MEIPEGLQNRCSDPHAAQESANTFRKAAEKLSEEMQLATWRAAASRLFAVAGPCTYVASLAGEGQQASLQLPRAVTQSMQELPLAQWPAWYEQQFDALVVTPTGKHEKLLLDENTPARVWREGRAKAEGLKLYPDDVPGKLPDRPKKKASG